MNKERLLKLADHLEFGTLGHRVFNFSRLNDGTVINKDTLCKTNGCAIGECPIVFPEDWEFVEMILFSSEIVPVLKNFDKDSNGSPSFKSAELFFDINEKESEILFIPSNYANENERNNDETGDYMNEEELCFGTKIILRQFGSATKEEIAKHIRYFVELKES